MQDPDEVRGVITMLLETNGSDPSPFFLHDPDWAKYMARPFGGDSIRFAGCPPIPNLGNLLADPEAIPSLRRAPGQYYVAYAHGDANLQNFLVDKNFNVWVIDFMFTRPDNHVLRDISKTWSCVMFVATTLNNESELQQACAMTSHLVSATDLNAPLPDSLPGVKKYHLQQCWLVLVRLWSHVGRIVREQRCVCTPHTQ